MRTWLRSEELNSNNIHVYIIKFSNLEFSKIKEERKTYRRLEDGMNPAAWIISWIRKRKLREKIMEKYQEWECENDYESPPSLLSQIHTRCRSLLWIGNITKRRGSPFLYLFIYLIFSTSLLASAPNSSEANKNRYK